jgi:hypothetical protein
VAREPGGAKKVDTRGSGKVFIAHEFDKTISRPLRKAVEEVLRANGYDPVFADNKYDGLILDTVRQSVIEAEFAIFDLSSTRGHLNLNVIFELGLAIGIKKPLYISVKREDFDTYQRSLADLQGLPVIQYETYDDLAKRIEESILPNHTVIPDEIKHFWKPFVADGCTVVFGVQSMRLDTQEIRAITGRYDNIIFSELYRFLASQVRSHLLRGSHFDTTFRAMPIDCHDRQKMKVYLRHLEKHLADIDKNLIVLGTPNINPAAELIMANMTGSPPFRISDEPSSPLGYVVNDYRRKCRSTFFRHDRNRKMGLWRSLGDPEPLVEYRTRDRSGGFIIRTKYHDREVLIISGYNGVATMGGLRTTMRDSDAVAELNRLQKRLQEYICVPYRTLYHTDSPQNEPYDATIEEQALVM